jgi:hypothetical protein
MTHLLNNSDPQRAGRNTLQLLGSVEAAKNRQKARNNQKRKAPSELYTPTRPTTPPHAMTAS